MNKTISGGKTWKPEKISPAKIEKYYNAFTTASILFMGSLIITGITTIIYLTQTLKL